MTESKRTHAAADAGLDPYIAETEAETRVRIDEQLRAAGWIADSKRLRFSRGTRPRKGLNLAIAEWPTESGPADYVLFIGLVPVATVEAKKKNKDVAGKLPQAGRYSRGLKQDGWTTAAAGPWGLYRVPFAISANGRPFNRQVLEKSGIWFHDLRKATNHPRPLTGWLTPDGCGALLRADVAKANRKLSTMPRDIAGLRPYQVEAVEAVDKAVNGIA